MLHIFLQNLPLWGRGKALLRLLKEIRQFLFIWIPQNAKLVMMGLKNETVCIDFSQFKR